MKKTNTLRRRTYKSSKRSLALMERRERLRIFELYDGPATDTAATLRHLEAIHKWIKSGELQDTTTAPVPPKKPDVKLVAKRP